MPMPAEGSTICPLAPINGGNHICYNKYAPSKSLAGSLCFHIVPTENRVKGFAQFQYSQKE